MIKLKELLTEKCWKGYTQYGMKKKGGKEVPNCIPVKEITEEIKDGDVFGNWTVVHFRPSYDSQRILRGGEFTIQNRVGRLGDKDGDLLKVEYDGTVWRTSYRNITYEGTTPEELMRKLSEHDTL